MKLLDLLDELHPTSVDRKYGGLRKKASLVKGWEKSKLPPGVRDLWKVNGKMLPKGEADSIVTKALRAARVPSEELEKMSLTDKLDKAKELKLKL